MREPLSAHIETDDISMILSGKGIPFEVDDRKYVIRQPSTDEYDEGTFVFSVVRKRTLNLPEISELRGVPCTDEEIESFDTEIQRLTSLSSDLRGFDEVRHGKVMKRIAEIITKKTKYSLADELADERASLARDRYLCARCLLKDGVPVVPDVTSPNADQLWEAVPIKVKNAARPAIWVTLRLVEDLPFGWDPSQELSVSSAQDLIRGLLEGSIILQPLKPSS